MSTCIIPNCRKVAPAAEPFCSDHRDKSPAARIAELEAALAPFAAIPLVYPRNGSELQWAELEWTDRGPYTASDVVLARSLIAKALSPTPAIIRGGNDE